MNGDMAAAGDLATGWLIGRAVEPQAGGSHHGADGHGLCLNCGTALVGDYCHACGQPEHIHNTLSSIGHDVLHGVFHFDGKVWRTVPMLFTRPGELTRRYIAGERARFVSPLALFLFSVFLMVATFETIGGPFGAAEPSGGNRDVKTMSKAEISAELDKNRAIRDALKDKREQLKARGLDVAGINARIASVDSDISAMRTAQILSLGEISTLSENDVDVHTGVPSLDERIKKALHSPELLLYKMQSSAYKFSWMLIPISLPFIWLLFAFRRDVGPYDHAIFAIYSLSAMTLGVVGLSVMRAAYFPASVIGLLLVFGPPLHMYKQLRGAYRIGRFGAAWRTVALLFSATVAVLLFFVSILSIAA